MRLTRKLENFRDAALALLYPLPCAACGTESVEDQADFPACAVCWSQTKLFSDEDALCWKCGELALRSVSKARREFVRCGRCDAWAFAAARACGDYGGALRAAVLRLKHEPKIGARLARLLFDARGREPLNRATLIAPIPLHAERERERKFNQAAIIARSLAKAAGLPCDERSLARTIHTEQHRAGMDRRARRESVENAFSVARPRLVANESVLLVDDVLTTGATASACAAALLEAGAKEVFILTIARA